MKNLMRYEGYTAQQRVDEILDKISKYGMISLRDDEKDFLNSHKMGNQEEIHNKMISNEIDTIFEYDGYFKFEYLETENYGDEVYYKGTLYVPDLILKNGKKIEGRLEGKIIVYSSGQTSPDFYSLKKDPHTNEEYDVFEFCNGLEYELDSFIDYVVGELDEKNKYL